MTKAEYELNKYWCHIRCKPDEKRCIDCNILKTLMEIHNDRKKEN